MNDEKSDVKMKDLFENAMVEIPDSLKKKLVDIPQTQPVWDWEIILQVAFLTPLLIWGLIKMIPFVIKSVKMFSELAIVSYGEPSISGQIPLDFATAMILGLIVVVYFALKDEKVC